MKLTELFALSIKQSFVHYIHLISGLMGVKGQLQKFGYRMVAFHDDEIIKETWVHRTSCRPTLLRVVIAKRNSKLSL